MLMLYTPVPRVLSDSNTVKFAKQWAVAPAVVAALNRMSSWTVLASVEIPEYK